MLQNVILFLLGFDESFGLVNPKTNGEERRVQLSCA